MTSGGLHAGHQPPPLAHRLGRSGCAGNRARDSRGAARRRAKPGRLPPEARQLRGDRTLRRHLVPQDRRDVRAQCRSRSGEQGAQRFIPAARHRPDLVHCAAGQHRLEARPDRCRHRRPARTDHRAHARRACRRRRETRSDRHHRDLAFPSRSHQRHQGQGRQEGLRQCGNPRTGAGMGVLDGRRQHECGARRDAAAASSTRGASSATSQAK